MSIAGLFLAAVGVYVLVASNGHRPTMLIGTMLLVLGILLMIVSAAMHFVTNKPNKPNDDQDRRSSFGNF